MAYSAAVAIVAAIAVSLPDIIMKQDHYDKEQRTEQVLQQP